MSAATPQPWTLFTTAWTALVIALWLGHESVKSTQMYLHADMRLKEKALSRIAPLGVNQARYRPCDKLLSFLESL
jgi:integrase/recombinase XerD